MRSHHPLHSACLYRSRRSGKHHSGEAGELGDKVCGITDAPASFEPDMEKHSGFPESRNEKGDKVTDGEGLADCTFFQAFITLFLKIDEYK